MGSRIPPKTLAKMLSTILVRTPDEYGLFWDRDGTMPWKECYWAFQEEPQLRFVRQATVRELVLLGFSLPFTLENERLRLVENERGSLRFEPSSPPERLFAGIRRRQYFAIQKKGLEPAGRSFVPLFVDRELAERVARRRDPRPILLEVRAAEAAAEGVCFFKFGDRLFLADSVPPTYLLFPRLSESERTALEEARARAKEKKRGEPSMASTDIPGAVRIEPRHLRGAFPDAVPDGAKRPRKKKKGKDWKRTARKDRRKREI